MDRLIDFRIDIGAESAGIDPGRACGGFGNDRPRHETARLDGSQLGNRHSVARDDDRLPGLDLAKHCGGVVAEFSLSDGFHPSQQNSTCSNQRLREVVKGGDGKTL